MTYLDEILKQQVIGKKSYDRKLMDDTIKKLAWDGLQKNRAMDGDTIIDGRTSEVLDPEVDYIYWKDKF